MATIRPYINHLLQNTGITPACSEEERTAADDLARIFKRHGFEPEVQEFSASGSKKIVSAVLGIAAFLGALLMGIGGVVGFVGILLTLAAAVIYTMERMGRPVLSGIGSGGLSQNVIAYHKASGPLASPRNRPVVVVAHYDSPRVDVLSQMPYAAYRPLMAKLLPAAMLAPAIIAIVRLLPFPDAAKTVFWLLAVVAALVPLANAVAIILNRFVLPYTTGSVCNKSSVAALLGVMNAVAPYRGENEFPGDIPFDEYFAEQRRVADELAAAALETEGDLDEILTDEDAVEEEGVAEDGAAIVESEDASDVAVDVAPADVSEPVDLGETQAMNMSDLMGQTATVSVTEGEKTGVVAAPEATVEDEQQTTIADEGAADAADDGAAIAEEPESAAPAQPSIINAAGNYRYGIEALRALGMVSESCVIEYDMPEPEPAAPAASEPARAVDAAAVRTVASVATAEPVLESATDPSVAAPLNEMAPERDPFAYHEDEDAFADDDRFDAAGEDAADDSFEGDFAYGEAYEDEGLEFSRRGAPRIEMATQNSLATALSAFGESASRFFSKALEHGKSALGEIENVARTAMEKRAAHDEADVLPADDEEILSEDIKDTVDSPDADTVDAASGDEVDATISAAPLSEDTADDAAADASADEGPFDPAALDSTRAFHADEVAESDETVERTAVAPAAPLPGETVAVPAQSVKQAALQ